MAAPAAPAVLAGARAQGAPAGARTEVAGPRGAAAPLEAGVLRRAALAPERCPAVTGGNEAVATGVRGATVARVHEMASAAVSVGRERSTTASDAGARA